MDHPIVQRDRLVAGIVRAVCTCCAIRQALVTQRDLDDSRRVCPATGQTYLDRGDGLFEPDGERMEATEIVPAAAPVSEVVESQLLSDRPKRTGPKTRIELERATFAGDEQQPGRQSWTGR